MAPQIQAWSYTSGGYPKAIQLSHIPLDDSPLRPTEILVRIKTAALNPVDIQLMNYPILPFLPEFLVPHKGIGEDFAGVVEQAGGSSGFKTGDEVLGVIFPFPNGTLQEVMRIDTAKSDNAVVPKPSDWTWEQAGALPLAWLTARKLIAKIEPWVGSNGKVAVLGGSSSSGMYAVHIAKQRGWNVAATCSGAKADFVRGMGASEIVDYRTASVAEQIKSFHPDAIIDCVGGTECVGLAKRYVTIVGDKTSRQSLGGSATYLFYPSMVLRSVLGWFGLGPSYICINYEVHQAWLEELLSLPADKIVIDSSFGFDQVREAYERMDSGRAMGKVVIKME